MNRWTPGEIDLVVAAVRAAPSVHNTRPWTLEFHEHGVSLFERFDRALPRHDPHGRDRLISCGAALSNLVLATRVLGWDPELTFLPDPARPDEVARLTIGGRREPSEVDITRHGAIVRRRSYRHPFTAARGPAGRPRLPAGARGLDGDGRRRGRGTHATRHARVGRARPPADHDPGPGRARRPAAPRVPAARGDPDDGRLDQVRAGMAAQTTWLAATAAGLAGSLLTQPFQVTEVRAGLVEGLALAGFPQALLRFGYPDETEEDVR